MTPTPRDVDWINHVNRVELRGRVARPPHFGTAVDGTAYCHLSVETAWVGGDRPKATHHDVMIWHSELMAELRSRAAEGARIYVIGRLDSLGRTIEIAAKHGAIRFIDSPNREAVA